MYIFMGNVFLVRTDYGLVVRLAKRHDRIFLPCCPFREPRRLDVGPWASR